MPTPQQTTPELSKGLKTILLLILVLPLILAIIFTVGQIYPATYVIHWLTGTDGMFPLKFAILLNYLLSLLPILGVLLVAAGVKKLITGNQ